MKDVIVHKVTLEHFGKALVATFAALCAALAPRVITALATTDPLGGEINLFSDTYLRLAFLVSLAIGIGTMLMMWRQPFDPPKIFTMALSFPALVAGGWNMTESVQELATNATKTTVRSISTLQERNIPILEPAKFQELISADPAVSSRPLYDEQAGPAGISLMSSAHASTGQEPGKKPLQVSQLLMQEQYLVVLHTYSDETEARDALATFRTVVPGATVITVRSSYYVVANPVPASISEATRLAGQLQDRFAQEPNIAASVGLLPVASGRR